MPCCIALAVAVGLTPEMPMIVSANLAKGAVAMAKRKVVVKRLNAIQNLGAMDVLCTDKTGTLTQDKIILEHHVDTHGQENQSVLALAWAQQPLSKRHQKPDGPGGHLLLKMSRALCATSGVQQSR